MGVDERLLDARHRLPDDTTAPGAHLAPSIIHPGSPMLRIRYRQGILVTPHGYPDWPLCARAVLDLPEPEPGLTFDEVRVVDVLSANLAMADDPLWTSDAAVTPAGWCWAHLGGEPRRVALVPIELHGSFRHAGGLWTLSVPGRGLRVDTSPVRVMPTAGEQLDDDLLDTLERVIGGPLPLSYRQFLLDTNGAGPDGPAVLSGHGFVADQPLFGIAREDWHQDVAEAWRWTRDRLTAEFFPIGYVQGGLLAVKVSGGDEGSIWYLDADDPRDREVFTAEDICARLLHRCADDIDAFWAALARPALDLVRSAERRVADGVVREVREEHTGAGLPARMRADWQPKPGAMRDAVTELFEAR